MADIRIKDLATTASVTASDDFMAVDGVTNGTRKLSAATPAFLTSVTTPSLTAPASSDLTLTGGSSGASLVLGQGANGAITTTLPGTGLATVVGTITAIGSTGVEGGVLRVRNNTTSVTTAPVFVLGINRQNSGVGALYLGSDGNNNAIISTGNGSLRIGNETAGIFTEYMKLTVTTGNVSIASTTAGASNAGALVVQGGISAGNTGSAASYFGGGVTTGGAIYSSSFLDATGGVGTPVSGHGQFSGSGTYGAVIAGYGSTYDFALFNRSGVDVLHVATNTTTVAFSGAATFAGAVTVGTNLNIAAASGVLTLGADARASDTFFDFNTAAANARVVRFQTGGVNRWQMGVTSTAESGSNAGSNWVLNAYSDAGALLNAPLSIARSTGAATFAGAVATGGNGTFGGNSLAGNRILTVSNTATADGAWASMAVDTSASGLKLVHLSSGWASTFLTGGPTTTQAAIYTSSSAPIVFGVNNTYVGKAESTGWTFAGAVTTSAPTGGAGAWELGIANAVSPTSPNRTITIEIGGTVYYLAAKTTND